MAVLTFRDGVMILELIFYTPALVLSIWLTARHGLWRRSGFIFLVLLALVRINGACMLLATLLHPDSIVLYTGAGILNSIALSPLLLSTIGLLGRVNDSLRCTEKGAFLPRTFRLLSIPTVTGLGLCVTGGTLTGISGDPTNIHITTKIGVILFVVAFAVINFITAITYHNLSYAEVKERQLGRIVAVSAPFLIVRTVYSVLGAFANNLKFNVLLGSVTIYLCMAVLEEFAIFVLFLAVGFTLRVIPKDHEVIDKEVAPNICATEG